LWDAQSGRCLAVFAGHSGYIWGALDLADGRILSWSNDKTFLLWDARSGQCLEVVSEKQARQGHPEWFYAREKTSNSKGVCGDYFAGSLSRSTFLRHKIISKPLVAWNADCNLSARCLLPDGTAIVTLANGQVCILKLHHGNHRVSLTEAEEIIAKQMKKQE
jgi:WD40 repeat protein